MQKWSAVLFAGLLWPACGSAPESTEVDQSELRVLPGGPGALVCCREKFRDAKRRGLCMAEAAHGQGPCAVGHHPGGGGGPGCKDAGAGKDASPDAGVDAAVDAGNRCPSIIGVSASPEAALPAKVDLSATVEDAPGAITFDWRLADGSVGSLQADPATPGATFVCTALGPQTVELTIVGGDPTAACASSESLAIDCTTLCGNGTVDLGETCDPPDGIACDATCNIQNRCPVIASVVPTAAVLYDFGNTILTASASDPDPADTLSYAWTATAGSFFGFPTSARPSYECTSVGVETITVAVSDGHCSAEASTQITCLGSCGNKVIEPGEQCDPPYTGPDGLQCDATCQLLTCGNGVIDPGEQCDPPKSGACSTTCQVVLCGNGVIDPGEQCDPPRSGVCSSTCQNIPPPPPSCGNGVIDPGETCDPPRGPSTNGGQLCDATCHVPTCGNLVLDPGEVCDPPNDTTCDRNCQPIPSACGDGIVQPGESCDLGPTTPVLCRNCQWTNCGGCFVSRGGGTGICTGLDVADTKACSALVTCAANNMAWCANGTAAACYCADALMNPNAPCSSGVDGPCVSQFQALAHSSDPAVVLAQIKDPTTPVGKVAVAMHTFGYSSMCGSACFIYNN